jgi:hypothetical protein
MCSVSEEVLNKSLDSLIRSMSQRNDLRNETDRLDQSVPHPCPHLSDPKNSGLILLDELAGAPDMWLHHLINLLVKEHA